ncbi:MAG: Maf family nucleotide pyrophosphatase [Bacteroidales bacterium]|nr:septum formation protein Maf [Lentimicrobiaceae bacterium]MDD5694130.1 Maf family nucleotide pyrophosphatase [Bacteroidales bacterium]
MPDLENLHQYHIILASRSPRRRHLLKELGVSFETVELETDESFPENLKREEIALYLAAAKARAFPASQLKSDTLLITADTIVCLDRHTIGKPVDRQDAIRLLKRLSGKKHEVITAVCLRTSSGTRSFFCETDVYFRDLSEEEITWYVDHFLPLDKAGAYGAQEWIGYIGITRINGSYFNVMGLPVHQLYEELKKIGTKDYE